MSRKSRRVFTSEERQAAVDLYRKVGSVRQAAFDLGIAESTVWRWVRKAEHAGVLEPPKDDPWPALEESEQQELERLRKEVKQLRVERDILKKAAAFFAKEDDSSSS